MLCFSSMPALTYSSLIKEKADVLLGLEKAQRQARIHNCVRFMRLLKEGRATTQQQAGEMVGRLAEPAFVEAVHAAGARFSSVNALQGQPGQARKPAAGAPVGTARPG